MAPEVLTQSSLSVKADIWSVGCLIIEMLSGSLPYSHFDEELTATKVRIYRPPRTCSIALPL